DTIQHDVSEMQIGDTLSLDAVRPPAGVTLVDDPETVIATLTPPRLQVEEEPEIEEETEVVGEGEAAPAAEAEPAGEGGGEEASEGARPMPSPGRGAPPVDGPLAARATPGAKYDATRHNVGFEIARTLAARWDLPKPKQKYRGLLTEGRTGPGGPRVAI